MYDAIRYTDSSDRLALLRETGLLGAPAFKMLDRWTRLGARVVGAPVSLLTLVDADRQVFVSQQGLGEPWATSRQTPLSHSFCQHVVEEGDSFIVRNAHEDSRVEGNLAIPELGVVGYLGIPLRVGGHVLGALCAITPEARDWSGDDVEALSMLAFGAAASIEERLRARRAIPESMEALAGQFGALAEPARLRLVLALGSDELTVGELAEATTTPQPNTSRHLAALLTQGIVERRRDGVRMYYRLAPGVLHRLRDVVWTLLDRAEEPARQ